MYQFVRLFVNMCLFNLILAELKSCDVKHDQVEVCYKDKEGYKTPFYNLSRRIELETTFF